MTDDAELSKIIIALSDLARLFGSDRVHEARVRGSGVQLSRTGLRILSHIDHSGAVSVSRLATSMDLSQPTASRSLAQLEADGLVARTADPGDGRVAVYTATSAGRAAHQRMSRYMRGQLDHALRDLPADQRTELADRLADLVHRLRTEDVNQ